MIDYEASLNAAQYAAATAADGPVLVVAGAGSGKTRTIVYRLAWLAEHGLPPQQMLLLTFTRKAAQEMLARASRLLEQGLAGVQGGTFHSFAYAVLRQFRPAWLEGRQPSLMDAADISAAVKQCKDELRLGKGDRAFPKTQNIVALLSKARNKELPLDEVIRRDAYHLLCYAEDLAHLDTNYRALRHKAGLLDYDDLLFELESVLRDNAEAAALLRARFSHIMVDEYQDTNRVQARIVRLLGGEGDSAGNVMAVGDEAQSIYAFRGADVRNILDFPTLFPHARVIRLEENYRSTQPVLDVANALLAHAPEGFQKHLFTKKQGGAAVRQVIPLSDLSQADVVVRRIQELLREHLPHEIAVLFRAGFHSYHLEMALNRAEIKFRKYGGLKYTEAAHVKDVMAYARLSLNPLDLSAFERVAALHRGVGPKTVQKLYGVAISGNPEALNAACAKFPDLLDDLHFLDDLRLRSLSPAGCLELILEHYRPRLEAAYPDDWPRRQQGLEEIVQMATSYTELDLFLADLALEAPEEDDMQDTENRITLSTVHSAKGLEWNAVIVLDLVEDRFPSRHAVTRPEDFEEERRLLYVACTRARQTLDLCVPASVYSRQENSTVFAVPSPFIRELPPRLCDIWVESYGGVLARRTGGVEGAGLPAARGLNPQDAAEGSQEYLPPAAPVVRPLARPSAPAGGQAAGRRSGRTDGIRGGTAGIPVGGAPSMGEYEAAMRGGVQGPDGKKLGYCRHKIFGRGKAIKFLPPDKMQVNFPGLGIKTILIDYLAMETAE